MFLFQKSILLSVVLFSQAFPQWEAGGTFNYKSESPEIGFGITAARNLPFQWPVIGFKVRAGFDLFKGEESVNGDNSKVSFSNEVLHADLIGTLFFRNFSPYFGLTLGVGHFSINHLNEYRFLIGILGGIKFPVTNRLQPMLEIDLYNFLGEFDEEKSGRKISNIHLIGRIGLIIKI
ncbi:MAG: hypothetical protein PVF17_03115 [Ignavibacteria bacterium]|jgi:hypothetical protein